MGVRQNRAPFVVLMGSNFVTWAALALGTHHRAVSSSAELATRRGSGVGATSGTRSIRSFGPAFASHTPGRGPGRQRSFPVPGGCVSREEGRPNTVWEVGCSITSLDGCRQVSCQVAKTSGTGMRASRETTQSGLMLVVPTWIGQSAAPALRAVAGPACHTPPPSRITEQTSGLVWHDPATSNGPARRQPRGAGGATWIPGDQRPARAGPTRGRPRVDSLA